MILKTLTGMDVYPRAYFWIKDNHLFLNEPESGLLVWIIQMGIPTHNDIYTLNTQVIIMTSQFKSWLHNNKSSICMLYQ